MMTDIKPWSQIELNDLLGRIIRMSKRIKCDYWSITIEDLGHMRGISSFRNRDSVSRMLSRIRKASPNSKGMLPRRDLAMEDKSGHFTSLRDTMRDNGLAVWEGDWTLAGETVTVSDFILTTGAKEFNGCIIMTKDQLQKYLDERG